MAAPPAAKKESNAKFTQVAMNEIWRERVKSEMSVFSLNEEFRANPYNISVITDKPNKLGKHYLDRDEALLQTLQSKLNNTQQTTQTNVQQTQRPQDTLKETQLRMSNAIIHFYVGESLLSVHKTPLEKYKFPQTSAQQIGWYSAEIHKIPPTKFAFAKKSCEETAYADVLIKSSTKTGGGGNDKKGGASPAKADKK